MADSFPQSHTTTTTTRSTTVTTTMSPTIHLEEVRSMLGIIKIAEIVLSILTFIFAAASDCSWYANVGFATFVGITGFFIAIAFFIFLILHLRQRIPESIPILLIELIIHAVWTFFFFVAVITLSVASNWTCRWSTVMGAILAFFAMVVFGFDTFLIFKEWKGRSTLPTTRSSQPAGVINP